MVPFLFTLEDFMRKTLWAATAAFALAGSARAEASLQQQIDELRAQVQQLQVEKEPSEPVELIKAVTEWVSPSGELFTERQPNDVSPTDGSPLTERQTFRKMKFSRHVPVQDKIDAAIASSVNGHIILGLTFVGLYQNLVGQGDALDSSGSTHTANVGALTGSSDITLLGKPMRNTVMFLDMNMGAGAGLDRVAPNGAVLTPNYLSGNTPTLREAWVLVSSPDRRYNAQAGIIDLSGSFDSNAVANDETTQFVTGGFVHSPLLMSPANSPGAVLRADFSRWGLKLGAQSTGGSLTQASDALYTAAELDYRYHFFGDALARVWARQQPRGSQQPDQAFGFSVDHRLSTKLNSFWRYAKSSYIEDASGAALNALDWSASAGLELGNLSYAHLKDRIGLAYGRTDEQSGSYEDFSELYYKTVLTNNFNVSVHGQAIFDRVRASVGGVQPDALPNLFVLGLRTQVSY
jgi:hypothetical protein